MNKLKKIFQINFLIFGIAIISGCGYSNDLVIVDDMQDNAIVEDNKSCQVNSDCVPASCCHANDVVNKENTPSCENLKCTASCETILDCGQGRPVCNDGQCEIERNVENNLGIEEIEEIDNINIIKACTKDVRVCSDGDVVGRSPENNCEFYSCNN